MVRARRHQGVDEAKMTLLCMFTALTDQPISCHLSKLFETKTSFLVSMTMTYLGRWPSKFDMTFEENQTAFKSQNNCPNHTPFTYKPQLNHPPLLPYLRP